MMAKPLRGSQMGSRKQECAGGRAHPQHINGCLQHGRAGMCWFVCLFLGWASRHNVSVVACAATEARHERRGSVWVPERKHGGIKNTSGCRAEQQGHIMTHTGVFLAMVMCARHGQTWPQERQKWHKRGGEATTGGQGFFPKKWHRGGLRQKAAEVQQGGGVLFSV